MNAEVRERQGDATAQQLAENLRRLRESRGWSQQQLADASGVPRPTIANLEGGDGNPTLSVMMRIAGALGATIEQLIAKADQRLEFVDGDALPQRALGASAIGRQLHVEASGVDIERIELPPKSVGALRPVVAGMQQIISCEIGRIELRVQGESKRMRAGDVARWRGQGQLVAENSAAKSATLVVATLPLPFGC
ncbi:MAG: helix-turn-helix transcriptional regulator [Polyangiaceae bacterium]